MIERGLICAAYTPWLCIDYGSPVYFNLFLLLLICLLFMVTRLWVINTGLLFRSNHSVAPGLIDTIDSLDLCTHKSLNTPRHSNSINVTTDRMIYYRTEIIYWGLGINRG